ncbi:MAG: HDOD domain-containing protein, partial [Verrucomicrobia bacterium]|nr:HDOD domain-containing protein [Verrucomicrobiota bacterium]
QMLDAIQSPNASVQRIAESASKDPAMCAKLLQLSNSAFFGFSREVYSVTEAVQILGAGTLQALALAVPLFSSFDRRKCPSFPIEQVWDHSAQTGALARQIASSHLGDAQLAEQAFAAGVLHDIGKLILADGMPDQYAAILATARAKSRPLFQVEREVLAQPDQHGRQQRCHRLRGHQRHDHAPIQRQRYGLPVDRRDYFHRQRRTDSRYLHGL